MGLHSLSVLVLIWMFGTWAVDGDTSIPSDVLALGTTATPLTIFASYFTVAGLAMVGLLGGWSAFLGIFRLRQNGNFFGSRDSNEAFFYPMRLIAALALCAPVIPISSPGGDNITLTPGHALIVGIAKTGSEWGDDGQRYSFRLMHSYNLFNDPDFLVGPKYDDSIKQLSNWFLLADKAASYIVQKNPYDELGSIDGATLAAALQEGKWKRSHPDFAPSAAYANSPFIGEILDRFYIPSIPPAGQSVIPIPEGSAAATVKREMGTEGMICTLTKISWACSSELQAVEEDNTKAIQEGIADAQRQAWSMVMAIALNLHQQAQAGTLSEAEAAKLSQDVKGYIPQLGEWYALHTADIVRQHIASQQLAKSEQFFEEMKAWGWMMGGTFALRAGEDFSRAQRYIDSTIGQLLPVSKLDDMTGGDVLSKMVQAESIKIAEAAVKEAPEDPSAVLNFFGLDILFSASPTHTNVGTITSFGRSLTGSALMVLGTSAVADAAGSGILNKVKINLASKILERIGKIGYVVGFALLMSGAMLGYVLPTVYAIFGIMGAVSWITFVASAFFGVNLWAAAQAAPKGEEHTSQMAAKGWNVLVFIGLYPVLAVAGLCAAIVVTGIGLPLATLLMSGLWGMFDAGVASKPMDGLAGMMIGGVVLICTYCFLIWTICITSAQLITQFPRTVLNMVSFNEPGLNPYEQAGQGVMSGVSGIAKSFTARHGLIGNTVHSGISRLLSSNLFGNRGNRAGGTP